MKSFSDKELKVAIVTDWMLSPGGADRFLLSLIRLYPNSTVFTSIYNKEKYTDRFEIPVEVRTTFLQKLPWKFELYRHYNFLTPFAFENLDLRGYDLVISLSAGPAKGIITRIDQKHLAVIFTPPRYLWDKDTNFRASPFRFLYQALTPFVSSWLRLWDSAVTKRIDSTISISEFIQKKVKKYYKLDSSVVYPGLENYWFVKSEVNIKEIKSKYHLPDKYFLVVSRLYDYKHVDIAIKAALKAEKYLLIVGSGPDKEYLEKLANGSKYILFLGRVSDEELKFFYSSSEALLFCGIEDFGYVPIEAMASGCPVLAYNEGGVKETVESSLTGEFFSTVPELTTILNKYKPNMYNKVDVVNQAKKFSEKEFYKKFNIEVKKLNER